MDSSFDLNIQNYTIKELEDIFELSHSYDENIVEMQETKLRQNILNDKNTVSTTKPNVLSFLTQIKSILVDNIKNVSTNLDKIPKQYEQLYNLDKNLHQSEIMDAGSTSIIQPKVTSYTNSLPSEFYKGSINPLEKRILKKNINIDSD